MKVYISCDVIDMVNDTIYCEMEADSSQKNLAKMEFCYLPVKTISDDFLPKEISKRIIVRKVTYESYPAFAIQQMFLFLRKSYAQEFQFQKSVPVVQQKKIIGEVGYPVLLPELMPVLGLSKHLRQHQEPQDAEAFEKWLHHVRQVEAFLEQQPAMLSYHIFSSLLRDNIDERSQAKKDYDSAIDLLLSMLDSPVPFLDDGEGYDALYKKPSLLSKNELSKRLDFLKENQTKLFACLDRQCLV